MADFKSKIRQEVEDLLKDVLEPLQVEDTARQIKHRLCFGVARMINQALNTLILCERADLAMHYAIHGERLMKLAIERGEWPAEISRKRYPACAVRRDQFEHLHGLNWMVTGREDDSLLESALEAATEYMEHLHSSPRPRYLPEFTRGYMDLAAKAGRFTDAIGALEYLRAAAECAKKRAFEDGPVCAGFYQDVWHALISCDSADDPLRSMREFFEVQGLWDPEARAPNMAGAIAPEWVSYVACKFIPGFLEGDFSRIGVVERIKHLFPEMLACDGG